MIIENTNSLARDHLANERTFLAWLRTGVTLMGVGVALVKFDAIISGFLFAFIGIIFILSSMKRFFEVMNSLNDGKFIINSKCIIIISIFSIISILLAFSIIYIEKYVI